jgi:hypothetical protein
MQLDDERKMKMIVIGNSFLILAIALKPQGRQRSQF